MQQATNRITFDDMRQSMKELGEQAGRGADTQERYLLRVIEGAYHNAVDLTDNKHGGGKDDAMILAGDYLSARNAATVFDSKSGSHQKLVSCIRTGIRLGMYPKGGEGEPMATVGNLMSIWRNAAKVADNRKNMKDAFNTLMDYARVQIRRDTLVGENELTGLCYKPPRDEPAPEKIIKNCVERLEKLVETGQDTSIEVETAIRELHDRLRDIAAKSP